MNDSLTRKFCESPRRWLVVATATLTLCVGLVLPRADDFVVKRRHCAALTKDLHHARRTAETLPEIEKRVAALNDKLKALESRTIDADRLAAYRSRIVDLVRSSGCQIRRIQVDAPVTRPWTTDDQPVAPPEGKGGEPTGFQLERRNLTLAVDGTMNEVNRLLDNLDAEATLAHPHALRLQAASRGGKEVMLELELWLYNLTRARG